MSVLNTYEGLVGMTTTGSAYYAKRQRAKSLFPEHRSKYNMAQVNQLV
jgi:hypothetical protein